MFVPRWLLVLAALATAPVIALSGPHPTSGAAGEARYVVRPGDTLWALAAAHYEGDPREGVWKIKQRNGLDRSGLVPGALLVLPP